MKASARRHQPDSQSSIPAPSPHLVESGRGLQIPAHQVHAMIRDVGSLPASDEHWIGGWRAFEGDDRDERVAMVVWMDRASHQVRSCTLVAEEIVGDALLMELFSAMGDPLPGCEAGRPRRISVAHAEIRGDLERALTPLAIPVDLVASDLLEDAMLTVAASLAYGDLAYLHGPGVQPRQVERFFEQAALLWRRALHTHTTPAQLFTVSGLAPFPVVVSMAEEQQQPWIRLYLADLDHVIGDILQQPQREGLHVLILTYAQEGEMQPAFFDEARVNGWSLPAPDIVPLLSVADAQDGLRAPTAADFELVAAALEALLLWDGSGPLDGRITHSLSCGRRVQVTWPVHFHPPE